jgi:hypothetical protein
MDPWIKWGQESSRTLQQFTVAADRQSILKQFGRFYPFLTSPWKSRRFVALSDYDSFRSRINPSASENGTRKSMNTPTVYRGG